MISTVWAICRSRRSSRGARSTRQRPPRSPRRVCLAAADGGADSDASLHGSSRLQRTGRSSLALRKRGCGLEKGKGGAACITVTAGKLCQAGTANETLQSWTGPFGSWLQVWHLWPALRNGTWQCCRWTGHSIRCQWAGERRHLGVHQLGMGGPQVGLSTCTLQQHAGQRHALTFCFCANPLANPPAGTGEKTCLQWRCPQVRQQRPGTFRCSWAGIQQLSSSECACHADTDALVAGNLRLVRGRPWARVWLMP